MRIPKHVPEVVGLIGSLALVFRREMRSISLMYFMNGRQRPTQDSWGSRGYTSGSIIRVFVLEIGGDGRFNLIPDAISPKDWLMRFTKKKRESVESGARSIQQGLCRRRILESSCVFSDRTGFIQTPSDKPFAWALFSRVTPAGINQATRTCSSSQSP